MSEHLTSLGRRVAVSDGWRLLRGMRTVEGWTVLYTRLQRDGRLYLRGQYEEPPEPDLPPWGSVEDVRPPGEYVPDLSDPCTIGGLEHLAVERCRELTGEQMEVHYIEGMDLEMPCWVVRISHYGRTRKCRTKAGALVEALELLDARPWEGVQDV